MPSVKSKAIQLYNVRISYPSLWRKAIFQNMTEEQKKNAKYGATFILCEDSKIRQREGKGQPWKELSVADIEKIASGLCEEMWKKKMGRKSFQQDNYFLKDGTTISEQADEPKPEYEGCQLVKTANWNRPKVLDRAVQVVTDEDADQIYAGCRVNASIVIQPWEGGGKKGVRAVLNGVQFWNDDEPFSTGGCNEDDEFDAAEDTTYDASEDDEL